MKISLNWLQVNNIPYSFFRLKQIIRLKGEKTTIIVDIINEEQLEREFEHIRTQFKDLTAEEKPLRIDWGTKAAFDSLESHNKTCDKVINKAKIALRIVDLLEILEIPEEVKEGIRNNLAGVAFSSL